MNSDIYFTHFVLFHSHSTSLKEYSLTKFFNKKAIHQSLKPIKNYAYLTQKLIIFKIIICFYANTL